MLTRILVIGFTTLAVVVIAIIAIVVSTSKGSEWSTEVWRQNDNDGDGDKDQEPEPPT